MARKTLLDCIMCQHHADCDLHVPEGTHRHLDGMDPCRMVYNPRECSSMAGKYDP
jgi:hypothetical protein